MPAKSTENQIKFLSRTSDKWESIFYNSSKGESEEDIKINKAQADSSRSALNELLLSSLQMQNLMVLSGSGTSIGTPVNGPSMKNLWDQVQSFKDDAGKTIKLSDIAKKIKYTASEENIEAFLSHCDAYLNINVDKTISFYISKCKAKIRELCDFEITEDKITGHATFLHRLSRRRVRDSRLKLFTTNYDLCFETAAGYQGLVVLDGFSFTHPRHYDPRFFNYDIVRRPRLSEDLGNYLEGVFHLYKLHGSVNWFRFFDNKYIQIKNGLESDEPCIIYPAKGKYQQSYIQPHLELMAQFLSSLREPNTCLIITGFGFNDDHLSEPILSAVKTNPHLRLIINDFKAEDNVSNGNHYWQELFGLSRRNEDIWFINSSFKDFADLIPDLKSLTPAEKLYQTIRSMSGDK